MQTISEVLRYEPSTGKLYWTTDVSARGRAGQQAGSVNKISGYREIRFKGKLYYAHRLAWYLHHGYHPNRIDHINSSRDDNRMSNLREDSQAENNRNVNISKNNTTGFKGVFEHRPGQFKAQICADKKSIHIGVYKTPLEAAYAYDDAAIRLHGNFAKTNQSMGLLP